MNRFRSVVGASLLALWVAAGCSNTASDEPAGQSGHAGAALGGATASAGARSPGKAGSGQQGGSAGASAGTSHGGGTSAGAGGADPDAGAGGAAGGSPAGPSKAMLGKLCPVESTIGMVQLAGFPTPYVQVTLYDGTDPWLGEPELSTPTCEFHHYEAGVCQGCQADEVCSRESTCVAERRTVKDATLHVSVGADAREYKADATLGGIYSMVDIGNAASSYAMTLSWGDVEVQLAAMPVASADLANAAVSVEGQSSAPGALDATWTPSQAGAFVRSRIPINHHAGGPTFTECAAPESAGSFHADAAMINPLAVVTGLEFQGLQHEFVAAANTPSGCVEFRFGEQIAILPD